jgi:hypothetical protein
VPDQRHALHQLLVGAHHPVKPPAVVIAPGVDRVKRLTMIIVRRGADQPGGSRWPRQRGDGRVHPQPRQSLGVPRARPETGPPQESGGLVLGEFAAIDGDR